MLRQIGELADLVEARVPDRHREDLLVAALLVAHEQRADGPRRQHAAGKGRLLDDHERVERVAVAGLGVHHESVIRGVMHRREQHAIEPDVARLLIQLVFRA